MVVAVVSWELALPGCHSLKEKRMVIRSLKDRLSNRFNVSVAETGHQDLWGRSRISVALIASDRAAADGILDRVDRLVEGESRALILETRREWR
jgi:uncharacterized protein